MASVKIVFRPSTKEGRHPGSLCLRVVHNRKQKVITILFGKVYPEEWDEEKQSLMYSDDSQQDERQVEVRKVLQTSFAKMNNVIYSLEAKDNYSVEDIVKRFKRSTDNTKLAGFTETLADELWNNGQYRTSKAYSTVCRRIIAFNKKNDIPLTEINAELIQRFEKQLKREGCLPNTISYYMRNLRAIYNKAIAEKRIPRCEENPFAKVYTGVEGTTRRPLTVDEIYQLKNINFDELFNEHASDTRQYKYIQGLYQAWRLFFFSMYAQGINFIDLCYLTKNNVKDNEIWYCRKTSGRWVIVPINEGMQRIMKSFEEEVSESEYLFPVLNAASDNLRTLYDTARRTQNKRLKKLAELAGIEDCQPDVP